MSVMRYLYGPSRRNVLPVFLLQRAPPVPTMWLRAATPPYPPPACGEYRRGRRLSHLTSGSTSNWWNGGGDGRVHSRVDVPGPHGLFAALSLRMKARTIP